MRKILIVASADRFRDEELSIPRQVFQSKGAEVTLASTRAGVIHGMMGAKEQAVDLSQVLTGDWDSLVIVGGAGAPQDLWDNKTLHHLIIRLHSAAKPVAAICLSGAVLAKAGIIHGVEATVYKSPASMQVYKECGVKYREKAVVVSGNIITANGPAAAREFALAVAEALGI